MSGSRGRLVAYGAGAALVCVGVAGLVTHTSATHPAGWFIWFAGAAVVHDAVVAPLVLAAGLLVRRLPATYRAVVRAAVVPAAVVVLVALPMVLGLGRRRDVPSRLPLAYGTNLAAVLVLIGLAGVAGVMLGLPARPGAGPRDAARDGRLPHRLIRTADGRWRLLGCVGVLAAMTAVLVAVV